MTKAYGKDQKPKLKIRKGEGNEMKSLPSPFFTVQSAQ
jgi:hypothetical protein